MNIIGKKVILRPVEENDLLQLQKWSNNPEIQYWLGGWHFPTPLLTMKDWFHRISNDPLNKRFAIEHTELGLLGTANLVEINWKDRNAFHGMLLGDKEIRGKGIGVDVVMSIMRYAFEELNLKRLDGSMIQYNKASLRLYIDKCGWKIEGEKKDWYYRKNQFWDKIIVGITKEQYFEHEANLKYWSNT